MFTTGNFILQAAAGPSEWHSINWSALARKVRSLQRRIVKAVQAGNWRKVKRLSHILAHSFAARALAIKRVTENRGKRTPGIDQEIWETEEDNHEAKSWTRARGEAVAW